MNRRPLVVKSCYVDFDFYTEVLKAYPLWIQLHGLPVACWGDDSLSRILNVVRIPNCAEECTLKQKRLQYATILVEVDVSVPLVEQVLIDIGSKELKQEVKYEFRPKFCQSCLQLGHVCLNPKKVMQWVPKRIPNTPPPQTVSTVTTPDVRIEKVDADNDLGW